MLRTVLAVAGLALGITAVVAQSDPIAARKALMKQNGEAAKSGAAMVKGEAPFDATKAQAIFTTFIDVSTKLPSLFPENSKTGGDTIASPKIWEDKAGFEAKAAKFGEDAKAAKSAVKDLDSFKSSFGNVTKNCGSCHETYRVKKS